MFDRPQFYLGVSEPNWLHRTERRLFVSHRRLAERGLPRKRAVAPWALDSGGFTELSMFGEWRTTPAEYVDAAETYAAEIGRLEWAAPQDWMCEPAIREQTGMTVAEHQHRTVENLIELRSQADHVRFVPVLQGWTLADYMAHIEMYRSAHFDLATEPRVGLGSVCRRQWSIEIDTIISEVLAETGASLHGFGVKIAGLRRYGSMLASADSMAWSYAGRRRPDPTHTGHLKCSNCIDYAMRWADQIERLPIQGRLIA